MKLNDDMLFAHPVLSRLSSDIADASLDASFDVTVDRSDNLDIRATISLKCPDLASLLQSGHAGCGFYLICRHTYQNRLIEMAPGTKLHRLAAGDFFGTMQLRPVIWSKQSKDDWKSASLHPEYSGSANLPAASILAFGDEQRFSIDRERLKPFESIFSLAAVEGQALGEIAVDTEPAKITIKVAPETKASIDGIRNSPVGRHILLNAVYLPALMQVLKEVAGDRSICERRAWFRIFEAKCSAAGVNSENPELLRDAQRLLGMPFRMIEAEKERLFS